MSHQDTNNLPLVPADDGFDDTDGDSRLVQGTILRCVDGRWMDRDKTPIPSETRLIALKTTMAVQRWQNKLPIETFVKTAGKALPDINALNSKIPEEQWEIGLDGGKRKPWVKQFVVYFLDPRDAGAFTFINSTVGAMIAVERLKDRVKYMRMMRGDQVVPLVALGSMPMTTKMGTKLRPEFVVQDWRSLGGLPAATTTLPAIEHIGKLVKPVTFAEELADELPSFDRDDDDVSEFGDSIS